MKFFQETGRLLLRLLFYSTFRLNFTYTDFDRKRKEPYILIANHTTALDALYIGVNLIHYPYPIANAFLYTNRLLNFLLTKLITSIPKRKGQSDIMTIKSILEAFKKDKRGVMLFPEGNASYFGAHTEVDLTSTAKLIKKLRHEVVMAKINGGYLAYPRWGKKAKRPPYHVHYYPLFKPEQIENLSLEAITNQLEEAMQFNDYDWNRVKRLKFRTRHRAEGLQYYIYVCPTCGGVQTIRTKGNNVSCTTCGKLATFNVYGLLEGLPFDNLLPWNDLQKAKIPEIAKTPLTSRGELFDIDFTKNRRISKGMMDIRLAEGLLSMKGKFQYEFHIDDIKGQVITQKNFLSFDHHDQTYFIAIKDPMLFLDVINHLKGE